MRRSLVEDVEKLLDSEKGKRFGGGSDFITHATRKLLEEYEYDKSNFKFIGTDENEQIILQEKKSGDIISLSIKKHKPTGESVLICNTCVDPDCEHRNFILSTPVGWDYMKKHDLKVHRVRDNGKEK